LDLLFVNSLAGERGSPPLSVYQPLKLLEFPSLFFTGGDDLLFVTSLAGERGAPPLSVYQPLKLFESPSLFLTGGDLRWDSSVFVFETRPFPRNFCNEYPDASEYRVVWVFSFWSNKLSLQVKTIGDDADSLSSCSTQFETRTPPG